MQPSTRRAFLAIAAMVTAGCSGLRDSSTTDSQLCDVGVVNQYESTVKVELRIQEDGELLIEEEALLRPPDEGARYGNALFLQEEQLPTDAGQYLVQMRVAGDEWEPLDTAEYDGPLLVWGSVTTIDDPDSPSITIDPKQGRC